MALRKLFAAGGFNVRDGLDDYDEDYTRFQSLGNAVTADMKYHAERRMRRRDEEEPAVGGEHEAETGVAPDAHADTAGPRDATPAANTHASGGDGEHDDEEETRGDDIG